jgi:uncharacterized protein
MMSIRAVSPGLACTLITVVAVFTGGCNAPKQHLTQFNEMVVTGDLAGAKDFAANRVRCGDKPGGEDLLWTLQVGSLERVGGHYTASSRAFDNSEEMIKFFNSEEAGLGHTLGAIAVNDNVVPYTGTTYDGVMVNTYKALNFMYENRPDLARVELNRALDRQRRAKETFQKEIRQLENELDAHENKAVVEQSLDNPDLKSRLAEAYPSLDSFRVYPDFVNPFATYLAGVFFTIDGDYNKAVDLLKESAGMLAENTYVLGDFGAVERALDGGGAVPPTVWVIFENGLGPVKEETRLDLPLFIATDNVRYVGIALPRLAERFEAMPYLEATAGGLGYRTQVVANIDAVVRTEFNKAFPAILTRAIISASAKAVAQYALQKNNSNDAASILMALYSFATTAADVRIWTMLPKNIQVAGFPMPDDRVVSLGGPGMETTALNIGDCNYAIVYVRMIHGGLAPHMDIMTF